MDSQINIGSLRLDIQTNQLMVDGCAQQVEPKLVAVLSFLYQHQNQVVKREQLIEVVWKGQVVSDNAINRSISQLRKLLKQSDLPHPTIETIPRVGYRLQIKTELEISDKKQRSKKGSRIPPLIKLPDKNSLKVILFLSFSLAIFGRYFYQLIYQADQTLEFTQSSLTLSPGPEKLPKISPDSQWLAYTATNKAGDGENLFAINLSSNQKVKLSSTPLYFIDLAWSPDSRSLAYSAWNSIHDRRCSIGLIQLESVQSSSSLKVFSDKKLLECSERAAVRLAWNQFADKVYLTSRPSYDRPYFVQSYSLDSKRVEQVTLPPQSGNLRGDYYISGSLSGKSLAIVRYLGTNQSQLTIYNTRKKEIVASQMLDSDISALTWSKDEQLIILKKNNLYLYDYNTNQEEFFYSIGKNSAGLTAEQNRRLVAFTVSERDINLVQYHRDQSSNQFREKGPIAESSAVEIMPSISRDRTKIAFLSNRTGSYQIWLSDRNGNVSQLSDSPVSLSLSPLSWSPNDKLILFQHDDEIFTIDVDTRVIERVIDRQHSVANADWSFDGDSVFYSSEKSGEWQIWQYELQQQSHRQVTKYGGYSAKQDRDNNLYVSRIHQDGLWKLPFDSGRKVFSTAELLLADFSGTNWVSWQLLENRIYYFGSIQDTAYNEKQFGIMQFDLSDYSTSLWFTFDWNHQRYFSLSGDQLIVTKVTRNDGSIELLTENSE